MREVIALRFSAVLEARYGLGHSCEFNVPLGRYVIVSPSSTGRPTKQLVVWRIDPATGKPPTLDPLGLLPMRELDEDCQREILAAMDQTALTNRHDGAGSWAKHVEAAEAHNAAVTAKAIRDAAELYALGLAEVDLRRPWLKHHSRNPTQRRIARGAR